MVSVTRLAEVGSVVKVTGASVVEDEEIVALLEPVEEAVTPLEPGKEEDPPLEPGVEEVAVLEAEEDAVALPLGVELGVLL